MDTLKHIIQETLDNFVSEAKKADRHEYWAERWKRHESKATNLLKTDVNILETTI